MNLDRYSLVMMDLDKFHPIHDYGFFALIKSKNSNVSHSTQRQMQCSSLLFVSLLSIFVEIVWNSNFLLR